jgi:high-affinity iron transporter
MINYSGRSLAVLDILILLFLTSISFNTSAGDVDYRTVVAEIVEVGDAETLKYQASSGVDSADVFSDLYFDIFEGKGMEQDLAMRDPELKTQLESYFSAVIGYASKGAEKNRLEEAWLTLKRALTETAASQNEDDGFWAVLIQAFLILAREGFEAILVVTALVTYLQRSAPERVKVIWYGVGWALIASLVTAYLLTYVFKISGAGREALEGYTMLIAAAVLFYVSYWMISKSEADKWQSFIRTQINAAVSSGSAWALGFAAFLAVYREGAETVLFYQALVASAGDENLAIILGFSVATIALVVIYYAMHKASVNIPITKFFTFTAILLYYLAFTFVGNGVLELQEARMVSISPLDELPRIGLIGFNPTVEGLFAQLAFILPLPYAYYILIIRARKRGQK